jgi:uncharacterized membrane protein (DUF106 family)
MIYIKIFSRKSFKVSELNQMHMLVSHKHKGLRSLAFQPSMLGTFHFILIFRAIYKRDHTCNEACLPIQK